MAKSTEKKALKKGKATFNLIGRAKVTDKTFNLDNSYDSGWTDNQMYLGVDCGNGNIVYAEMYAQSGYESTNDYFCNKILDIDSFVLLNSFSNAYLKAITNSGYVIEDEGEIVEWCNRGDKIESCLYGTVLNTELNPCAVASIESADLIIISTGTFWSSIYPTLEFGDLYKLINKNTHAKKVWALNCEEDKDSYGVSADEFISHLRKLG